MPPKVKAPAKPKVQKMVGKPTQALGDSEGASDEDDVAQSKANAKLAPKSSNANVIRNCSIVTVPGGEIPTIVGPISQWAPVVENLPNNPTCVSLLMLSRAYIGRLQKLHNSRTPTTLCTPNVSESVL